MGAKDCIDAQLGRSVAWALLALAACSPTESSDSGQPQVSAPAKVAGDLQFVEEGPSRGVNFEHVASRTSEKWMPEILGAGVAVADFNRDGAPDLFFVGGGDLSKSARPKAAKDRLFLNDGQGKFEDVSDAWGLLGRGYGMGVATGDYDNDGWVDLMLTSFDSGEQLLRNTGSSFVDVSAEAGMDDKLPWGASLGFFDYDLDGDLDVYVTRYVAYELEDALKCWANMRHTYCSPTMFDAVPDTLWLNQGDGSFRDASVESGVADHSCNGLALALGDLDWDGDVDAFVANDTTRNLLWMNDGEGHFVDRAPTSGTAYDETGRASAGMGADFSDVDGNGMQDIVCTNFQDETSNVFMQVAPNVFRDRAYAVGVGNSAQQRLSFGADFFDADNDGDEDLIAANGHIDDGIGGVSENISFAQQNSLYELEGGRFREVSETAGKAMELVEVSRACVSADLDGDLLLDLVITNNSGPARLLMNRSDVQGAQAVVLWLEGAQSNRSAIGARVEARIGELELRREVRGSSSYLSQCDPRVHLGLGAAPQIDELRVLWPHGEAQTFAGLKPGFYRIVQGSEPEAFKPGAKVLAPR